jgi:alpha-tubulin suppressor-like RCC1 family protein
MRAMTDRGWRASARMRLVVLAAAAALVGGAVMATRASSAGPSAGQLIGFGQNTSGQLGPNRPDNDPTPAVIDLPAAAAGGSAGQNHTLVVGTTGTLYAFGANHDGELGNTTNVGMFVKNPQPKPVALPGATGGVVQAAAGYNFSLAVTSAGELYAFGSNGSGQLGNGTSDSGAHATPGAVTLAGDTGQILQAAAGLGFSLARTSDDQVWAWGSNQYGQLGATNNVGTATANPTPLPVTPSHAGRIISLAAGVQHALALTSSGQVLSWGDDEYGQLGRAVGGGGSFDSFPDTVLFPGLSGSIIAIAAGGYHSLALSSSGQLYAWGENNEGQLGNTTNNGSSNPNQTPAVVAVPAGAGTIVRIAGGIDFTLALTSSGRLYGFGDNSAGQLGVTTNSGTTVPNPAPAPITAPGATLDDVASGAAGYHTLAFVAALTVTTSVLPDGTTGAAYSAQAAGSGGTTPYQWTAGGLAPGLSISSAGTITGVPTTAGQYTPTLTATDSRGISASVRAVLTVASPSTHTTTTPTTGKTPGRHSARVSLPAVAVAGPEATLTAECTGSAGQVCTGAITGTTAEHLVSGKLVSVTAAKTKPKPKTKTKKLKVASRRYTIKAGSSARIAIALNKAGRKLLDHFYSVPVKLAITNSGERTTQKTTFRYGLIRAPIDYFWNYRRSYTFVGNLSVSALKRSWHVTLTCQGGGCPVKRKALKIHGGKTSATAALKGVHLRAGAIVQLTISGANEVAEVLRFTVVPNALPRTTALCQTPDQHAPGACSR